MFRAAVRSRAARSPGRYLWARTSRYGPWRRITRELSCSLSLSLSLSLPLDPFEARPTGEPRLASLSSRSGVLVAADDCTAESAEHRTAAGLYKHFTATPAQYNTPPYFAFIFAGARSHAPRSWTLCRLELAQRASSMGALRREITRNSDNDTSVARCNACLYATNTCLSETLLPCRHIALPLSFSLPCEPTSSTPKRLLLRSKIWATIIWQIRLINSGIKLSGMCFHRKFRLRLAHQYPLLVAKVEGE